MPDRFGDDGLPDDLWAARRRKAEADIVACGLCDDDGYRGGTVCDHTDHAEAARRGMDMVRRAMGWTQ